MYILCTLSCLLLFLFSLNLLFICSSFILSRNASIQRRGLILSLNNPSLLEWDDKYKPATSNNDAFQDFLGFVKRVHQHQESDRKFFKSFNLANLGDFAVLSKKAGKFVPSIETAMGTDAEIAEQGQFNRLL